MIHNKDYSFTQLQDLDDMVIKAMGDKKEKFFYAYIDRRGYLRIEQEIDPKKYWRYA